MFAGGGSDGAVSVMRGGGSGVFRPMRAARTVTFVALKPGLLQGDGPGLAGEIQLVDIGVPIGVPDIAVVEDDDVRRLLPPRLRLLPLLHRNQRSRTER